MAHRNSNNPYAVPTSARPHSQQGHPQPRSTHPRHPSSFRPSGVWSAADDAKLKDARARSGNWAEISAKYFPSKTPNACRKRHERLMERASTDEWDGVKLETLAAEYCRAREEMWKVMGERLNEKWTVVEAKCMEKGVKTLLAVQRQSERQQASNLEESISNDSGIALEDGEYELDPAVHYTRENIDMNMRHHHHQHHHQQQHPHQHQHQHQHQHYANMGMLQPSQAIASQARNGYLPIASMLAPNQVNAF